MAKKPTDGAFIAEALLIDTKPTAYNTRFRPSALQQVASTINEKGLPLLLVHDSSRLPIGAWYEARVDNNVEAVFTKFYIPKEVREYEDVKTRIDTGILDSVSIGFRAEKHDCSICGNDIQDYESCPHIPGREYEVKDPESGAPLGKEVCYVLLDDVRASEASLVYSGAVPNAKIVEFDDKKEFFTKNHLTFDEGVLEIVHVGKFMQDNNEQNKNREDGAMDKEKFQELQAEYQNLKARFADQKDQLLTYKEQAIEFKEKAGKYDEAVAAKEQAETKFRETINTLQEEVAKLAAPFEPEYKAPEDIDSIVADLKKFIEEAKKLPVGQQHITGEEELAYVEPDDAFKV